MRPRDADQHAAAGARPAQRRDLCRGVAQAGRARARERGRVAGGADRPRRFALIVLAGRPTPTELADPAGRITSGPGAASAPIPASPPQAGRASASRRATSASIAAELAAYTATVEPDLEPGRER